MHTNGVEWEELINREQFWEWVVLGCLEGQSEGRESQEMDGRQFAPETCIRPSV